METVETSISTQNNRFFRALNRSVLPKMFNFTIERELPFPT